jgi:hypothetical protein
VVCAAASTLCGCTGWRGGTVVDYDEEGNRRETPHLSWQPGRKDQKDIATDFDPNIKPPEP